MSKITINNNSIFSDMDVLYYCAKDATTDQHGAEREKWERKKKKDLMIKIIQRGNTFTVTDLEDE